MKINMLTSFAAGMVLSTGIVGAVYLSNETGTKEKVSSSDTEQISDETLKSQLTEKGYVVLTEDEYKQQLTSQTEEPATEENTKDSEKNTESKEKEKATETKTEPKKETSNNEKKESTRVTVSVKPGMTSYDVGQILQENELIDQSAFNFSKEIEKRGLDKSLQIGKYVVTSNMSYEKIISTIFK